jgi:hypothetical protein
VTPQTRLVGVGAGWALAVALPADLVAQVADAARSGNGHSPLVYPCVAVILLGMGIGGAVVGAGARRSGDLPTPPNRLGALAGLVALAVILVLGIGRSLLAGDDVSWGAVPVLLVLGAGCGAIGAAVGGARARTSRP